VSATSDIGYFELDRFFGGRPGGRVSCLGGFTGFCQPPSRKRFSVSVVVVLGALEEFPFRFGMRVL
jgi:hypothetical protein